jgi:hypothetical protein
MGWLKNLFGGGSSDSESAKASKSLEYKGFMIEAKPYKEGGQYQLAGLISKDVGGARKEQNFVRADRFTSIDEAVDIALAKGRQIIDEQGEKLFSA